MHINTPHTTVISLMNIFVDFIYILPRGKELVEVVGASDLDPSWARCCGPVLLEGPGADPGHAAKVISLSWLLLP